MQIWSARPTIFRRKAPVEAALFKYLNVELSHYLDFLVHSAAGTIVGGYIGVGTSRFPTCWPDPDTSPTPDISMYILRDVRVSERLPKGSLISTFLRMGAAVGLFCGSAPP